MTVFNKPRIIIYLLIIVAVFYLPSCEGKSESAGKFTDVDSLVAYTKTEIQEKTIEELMAMQKEGEMYTLLDVRTREEHDKGYIPGTVNLARGVIEFKILKEDFWDEEGLYVPLKDDLIILYCRSGNRSALATKSLQDLGFTNVFSLHGGFTLWKETYPESTEMNLPSVLPGEMVTASEDTGGC